MNTQVLKTISYLLIFTFSTAVSFISIFAQSEAQYASGWSVNNNADWTPFPPSTNPLNAPDANCTGASTPTGSWAEFTFPAFSIPAGNIIKGVEIKPKYFCSASNTMQLTKSGGLIGNTRTAPLSFSGPSNCNSTAFVTSGSPTDLWNASLTIADFNGGLIGVRLTQDANTVDLDAIQMVVHYGPVNSDPDCSAAAIAQKTADASCQATISGSDVTGVTDPDMDPLTITVSPTLLGLGANNVKVTADDGNGGMCMINITVNVVDNTAPVITCPANITTTNDPGQCGAMVTFIVGISDNCDPNPTLVCTPASGSFFPVGTTMVSCTLTDAAGNSDMCSFTVRVDDTEPPVITCPAAMIVECSAAIPPCNTASAVVMDNCPISSPTTCSDGALVGDECGGTVTRTYMITDDAGNSASCTQLITIVPPLPVFNSPPGNLQLPCNVLPQPSMLSWTRGTGICQTSGQVQSTLIGIVGLCEGFVTERWQYTDACNVTITHERQVFYKIDVIKPVLTGVPADIFIPCGSNLPAWPAVTATDNCDGAVPVIRKQQKTGTRCGNILYERVWSAKDECGNTIVAKQTISFLDTEPPVLNVPNDTTVYCASAVPLPKYVSYDKCSWNSVEYKEKKTTHNSCEFTLQRTWTATDGCGNSVQKSQTIEVVDTAAPMIKVTNPMLKHLSSGGEIKMYTCETPQVSSSDIIVTDCCPDVKIKTYDQLLDIANCKELGYHQKWRCGYIATDGAGNTTEFFFYVFLCDTSAPVLNNVPKDTILACYQTIPPLDSNLVTASDNCSTKTNPQISEQYLVDPADSSHIALLRKWYFEDACGNAVEASQYIFICEMDSSANIDTTVLDTGISVGDTTEVDTAEVDATEVDTTEVDNGAVDDSTETDGEDEAAQVIIDSTGLIVGVHHYFSSLEVYPNPARTTLNIRFEVSENDILQIKLLDKIGRVLQRHTRSFVKGQYQDSFDVSKYPNGLYWIILESNNGIEHKSVIKTD